MVCLHPETGSYYTLNSIGGEILEYCVEERSWDQIMQMIAENYTPQGDSWKGEIAAYMETLVQEKLILVSQE